MDNKKINLSKMNMVQRLQLTGYLKISFIYILLYIIALGAFSAYFAYHHGVAQVSFQVDTFAIITKVFLLIIGIVNFTVTFKDYIVQGVTRKEYLVGTLTAIALLSVGFTVLLTIIYMVVNYANGNIVDISDTVLLMVASLLLYYTYFIVGWFIGMCFVKYRIIGGIMSVIISGGCIAVMEITTSIGFVSLVGDLDMTTPMSIPLGYNLLSTIIIAFLISYFVYSKTKKIYFKL